MSVKTLSRLLSSKILALLIFSLGSASVFAGVLWKDSAFLPRISSSFTSSILGDNDSYFNLGPLAVEKGLHHPFESSAAFHQSLRDAFAPGYPRYSLLQYAHQDSAVKFLGELNFILGYDHRLDDPGSYGFIYKGVRFNAILNERFRLRALWWNGVYTGDDEAAEGSPLIDGYYTKKEQIRLDNLNADISYRNDWLTASLGRGKFQVGNSISGSLVLSEEVNDYGYFLAEARIGTFQLSFLHGSLTAEVPSTEERSAINDIPDKYVAVHQVTYKPRDWFIIFGGESVIYGNRGVDLNYLLPHTFWRVTEHNLWDRDNVVIFIGTNLNPVRNLTWYLNGVLDELTYSKLFTNWWGNKYAVQTGIALDLPSLATTAEALPRLGFELTAVRPWTYTHYTNHTRYSHDGRPLGYAKGSNLVDVSAELNFPLKAWLQWNSTISHTWQGSVGNHWSLDYMDYFAGAEMDTAETVWLEGDIAKILTIQNNLRVSIMAHHSFLIGHSSILGDNGRHQLFGSWQFSF